MLGTTLRGGGGGEVWTQCTWVPACDGGAAVLHRGCVHRPRGQDDDVVGSGDNSEEAMGSGTAGGGRL